MTLGKQGRQGDGKGRETKTERGAYAQEGTQATQEGKAGEGVSHREDELLRARQRSLAHRASLEPRALLLLHERKQQHVLVCAHHQRHA